MSWARWIQSTHLTYLYSILVFSSRLHLVLKTCLFPSTSVWYKNSTRPSLKNMFTVLCIAPFHSCLYSFQVLCNGYLLDVTFAIRVMDSLLLCGGNILDIGVLEHAINHHSIKKVALWVLAAGLISSLDTTVVCSITLLTSSSLRNLLNGRISISRKPLLTMSCG